MPSNYQDNIKEGDLVYTAGGTIVEGTLLTHSSSARTVVPVSAGTIPMYVATSAASSGESVQCRPINSWREMRVRANGAIVQGALCEPILSGADAGKIQTHGTGQPLFMCIVTAADEDLALVRSIPIQYTTQGLGRPTPVAYNATATLTAADLVSGYITSTGVTGPTVLTTPTGALLDAAAPGIPVGGAFDFHVTNTGTGAATDVTISPGSGVTMVGNATVGSLTDATIIHSSGWFRAVRTAAETWSIYRL